MLCNKCGNTASMCLCQLKDHGATATEMDGFDKWCKENFVVPISKDDVLHECWQEATKVERDRIAKMFLEWKRHQDIMSGRKPLYCSMCIDEILDRIEVK